jgi:hypothetical protein
MWVYGCFEGDNLTLALAQHDLYFGANLAREQWIGRHSSPSYLWAAALERVAQRASAVPWLARHRSRLATIDSSDEPYDRFNELLVERYGFECVALTWRSAEPRLVAAASRAGQNAGQMPERSKA